MGKKEKIFFTLFLSVGFLLRILRLRKLMGFDYDQEAAAFVVKSILAGKPTLIGQEISIGGVFLGPVYYYLLSLFYWLFKGDPIAAGFMVALFSVITMILVFILTKHIFGFRTAALALALYTTSAQINFYDRTTAPSNLIMLMTLLAVYLFFKIKLGNRNLLSFLVLIISISVFQFHPTSFVLFPLVFYFWWLFKLPKPSSRQIMAALFMVLVVISPLLIFDLRHDFLNSKGMLIALSTQGEEAYFFIFKFLQNLRIQFQNLASLFSLKSLNGFFAATTLILFWKSEKSEYKHLLTAWILIPTIALSFYSRHIPEYYFLTSLPAFVIIIAVTVDRFFDSRFRIPVFITFFLILLANLISLKNTSNPLSLFYKQQAVNFIKQNPAPQTAVTFDTDKGLEAGFNYLLSTMNIRIANANFTPTHIIVIPKDRRVVSQGESIFGGIKVIQSQSTTSTN